MRALRFFFASALLPGCLFAAAATPEYEAAAALVRDKRYPEAQAALEKIVEQDPKNALALHELGLLLKRRNDNASFEKALVLLARAAELAPDNAIYLGDFGGTSLQLASRTNSLSAATRGRDAMEKAVKLDPGYLDAREGLVQFYERAPWPIGSSAKAAAHLEEIRRRDPDRAAILGVIMKTQAKDYATAFRLCDEALARRADDYQALYQYGRTASISGQNLERGLECLDRCLKLEPPSAASPTHSNALRWVGAIQELLHHPDEARRAYETALSLDPGNTGAAAALTRLK